MPSTENLHDQMLTSTINELNQQVTEFYSEADIRKKALD